MLGLVGVLLEGLALLAALWEAPSPYWLSSSATMGSVEFEEGSIP